MVHSLPPAMPFTMGKILTSFVTCAKICLCSRRYHHGGPCCQPDGRGPSSKIQSSTGIFWTTPGARCHTLASQGADFESEISIAWGIWGALRISPKVMVFGGGVFGKSSGHEGGASCVGLAAS